MAQQNSDRHSLLLMGLRETGKTTFLAALWHVVRNGGVPGCLVLQHIYEGPRDYIEARHQEWLQYRDVQRTATDIQDPIELTLRDPASDTHLHVVIPDLSGETYREQFEGRRWTRRFRELAQSATGILLYVHPGRIQMPDMINDAKRAAAEWEADTSAAQAPTEKAPAPAAKAAVKPEPTEWEIGRCVTAVKNVDLLQFLLRDCEHESLRVAVVISAFDELDGTPLAGKPISFLEERLPLLSQFLRANPERVEHRVYGVSAQGTAYTDENRVSQLQEDLEAMTRIRVVTEVPPNETHDITAPLRWLMTGT